MAGAASCRQLQVVGLLSECQCSWGAPSENVEQAPVLGGDIPAPDHPPRDFDGLMSLKVVPVRRIDLHWVLRGLREAEEIPDRLGRVGIALVVRHCLRTNGLHTKDADTNHYTPRCTTVQHLTAAL